MAMLLAALVYPFCVSAQTLAQALDTTNLVWTTGGNANWFAQTTNTHDGVDAVRNGIVGSNETSWIEVTVIGPATVTFWKFDSLGNGTVGNSLTINGEPRSQFVSQIGPTGTWWQDVLDLAHGTNKLRWTTAGPVAGQGGPFPPPWPPGNTNASYFALDEVAVLPPRPLAFTEQPGSQEVYPGTEWVAFAFDAVGTPPLWLQWQFNGTSMAGETNGFIFIPSPTTNDLGAYSVIVSNSQGIIVSSNATLTFLPPTAPTLVYQLESSTVYSGQGFWLQAFSEGSPPLHYQWRKDGTNIPGASGIGSPSYGGGYGGDVSSLISNVTLLDAGNYSVVVSNSAGVVESSNAMLTVLQSVLPVITHQPRSLEVATGVNTWFSTAATGIPEPDIWWTQLDLPPPPPDSPPIGFPGGNPSHRYFSNVTISNAGVYVASVTNAAGGLNSREVLLTVLPPITNVGSWTEGAIDIWVTNGLAYLAQDTNGLAILDVSNPASPQLLGRCDTPGHAVSVRVSGGFAYVADEAAGVQIISITNPANPVLIGNYNTAGSAHDLAVRSNLVFVADDEAGLLVLSVTNPAAPSVVGKYTNNFSAACISLSGNFAISSSMSHIHVTGQTNIQFGGLFVFDISNPAQPVEVGRYGTSFATAIARMPNLFASTGSGAIFSFSNAAPPTMIGGFATFYAYDLALSGDLLYAAGYSGTNSGIYVLDVRDPSEPIPVGYFGLPGNVGTLAVDGHRVYTAGFDTPLRILEVPFNSQPDLPPTLSLSKQGGMKLGVQGRRGLHYTIESAAGLTGFSWQPVQTLLLTNDTAVLDLPASTGTKFFRARRLD